MKQEEGKKKGKMVKRQVSIITVFLWIFLVTTMITITTSSIRKNNSIVEVDDENWNVSLVMYDRSSDTPTQAITDFTWNAEKPNEAKELCMQINYNCTTGKAYNPGELVIEIPGISKDSFSEHNRSGSIYSDWLENNVTIAADKTIDTTKKYDWSYSYDETNNIYTFINNGIIEENEHFEGTIQIVYNLVSKFRIQTDLEFKAKLKENIINIEEITIKESNVCNFYYTSIKSSYELHGNYYVAPKNDYTKIEDILDDYYWTKYEIHYSGKKNNIGAYGERGFLVSGSNGSSSCIKNELPEGCVLYDEKINKLEPKIGNEYYYLESTGNAMESYYVGYPKSKYNEGDSVTNTVELWGRYEDEEEIQKLSEYQYTIRLKNHNFEYKGELYNISKSCYAYSANKNLIEVKYESIRWKLGFSSFYVDSLMDVEIGDDLLYITRKNGEVNKLEDYEYNFTSIRYTHSVHI